MYCAFDLLLELNGRECIISVSVVMIDTDTSTPPLKGQLTDLATGPVLVLNSWRFNTPANTNRQTQVHSHTDEQSHTQLLSAHLPVQSPAVARDRIHFHYKHEYMILAMK